jgi:PAS domain S-box-containing protein
VVGKVRFPSTASGGGVTGQTRVPPDSGRADGEAWCDEVFDSSPVGIVISTPGGRIGRTNPSLDDLLGYSRGELPGRDLIELVEPDDVDAMRQRYQRLRDGMDTRFRAQCRLRRKDGATAWVDLAVSVLRDSGQQPRHVATVVEDVTDRYLL